MTLEQNNKLIKQKQKMLGLSFFFKFSKKKKKKNIKVFYIERSQNKKSYSKNPKTCLSNSVPFEIDCS